MIPGKIFKILCACLCIYAASASAQIGFEASLASPNGDIGQFFKENVSADLYFLNCSDDDRFRVRIGVFYTKLSPRLDTFPIYGVQFSGMNNTLVVPGVLVEGKLTMEYIYGDLSYRIAKMKKFSLFAGLGIEAGKVHETHYRELETIITDNTNSDVLVGGYKAKSSIEYEINPRFDVYVQGNYIHMVSTNHSTNFTHTTIGAGTNFYFKARKKHRKPHRHKHKHK